MIEVLADWFVRLMEVLGYPGVFILMTLESMIAPVPSELVMPFAGYLVYQGKMSWFGAILASTLGSIAGSLLSYWIGLVGGNPLVKKVGKYFFLDEGHLIWTEKYFERRGTITIFVARFIPVVRHLISIPAGIARMRLFPFLLYTTIGATLWNVVLLYAGFALGPQYFLVEKYSEPLDYIVLGLLVMALVWFAHHLATNSKRKHKV